MKIALLQLNSTSDLNENFTIFRSCALEAASNGAEFILSPEVTNIITSSHESRLKAGERSNVARYLEFCSELCRTNKLSFLIGSLAVNGPNQRCYNRQYFIDDKGETAQIYDKIHMFDIKISETEIYQESDYFIPGNHAKIANFKDVSLGMTICYDLRFSELYKTLAKQGANVFAVPAAFTETTGKLHWEVLIRSRAIESGAFVLAPAQCGKHDDEGKRVSHGHSMIVSPWGQVIARLGEKVGICYGEIDPTVSADYRNKIPNLSHIKSFQLKE